MKRVRPDSTAPVYQSQLAERNNNTHSPELLAEVWELLAEFQEKEDRTAFRSCNRHLYSVYADTVNWNALVRKFFPLSNEKNLTNALEHKRFQDLFQAEENLRKSLYTLDDGFDPQIDLDAEPPTLAVEDEMIYFITEHREEKPKIDKKINVWNWQKKEFHTSYFFKNPKNLHIQNGRVCVIQENDTIEIRSLKANEKIAQIKHPCGTAWNDEPSTLAIEIKEPFLCIAFPNPNIPKQKLPYGQSLSYGTIAVWNYFSSEEGQILQPPYCLYKKYPIPLHLTDTTLHASMDPHEKEAKSGCDSVKHHAIWDLQNFPSIQDPQQRENSFTHSIQTHANYLFCDSLYSTRENALFLPDLLDSNAPTKKINFENRDKDEMTFHPFGHSMLCAIERPFSRNPYDNDMRTCLELGVIGIKTQSFAPCIPKASLDFNRVLNYTLREDQLFLIMPNGIKILDFGFPIEPMQKALEAKNFLLLKELYENLSPHRKNFIDKISLEISQWDTPALLQKVLEGYSSIELLEKVIQRLPGDVNSKVRAR